MDEKNEVNDVTSALDKMLFRIEKLEREKELLSQEIIDVSKQHEDVDYIALKAELLKVKEIIVLLQNEVEKGKKYLSEKYFF